MKAHFVSLGCPKNLTDTEVLMGKLAASGHEITTDPSEAETIIVNTCAFIKSAREEAAETIREMARWKKKGKCKKLYVAGCLPKLRAQNTGTLKAVDGEINTLGLFSHEVPRIKATPPWYAYVKIAEGCNHHCSYCLIPKIRGKRRDRKTADILEEVKQQAARGVKEIIFVAEDTTAHPDLPGLLRKTAGLSDIQWVRFLYAYPARVSDELLGAMAAEKKIVKYLDLPIQHASDKILGLMNRRYTRRELEKLILKIRRRMPKIALRTSVIVGFPGEGEAEFAELLEFIQEVKFERLGAFTYSPEEGTPAYRQASLRAKRRGQDSGGRLQKLMRVQARVSRELNKTMIGKALEVMIEREIRGGFAGRSFMDAPEIDGTVLLKSNKILKPGEMVRARITGAKTYDLIGSVP